MIADMSLEECNRLRFDQNARLGHYESYFLRANHPTRPLAFWIRYTLFSPRNEADRAEGELWAIWFDGERGSIKRAYRAVPFALCRASTAPWSFDIAGSKLDDHTANGTAESIGWKLEYQGGEQPLLLFPKAFYSRPLPKAKVLVGRPNCSFSGTVTVEGESHPIESWVGSQNHNYGSQHTDLYAWGQVCGFDNEPQSFLEVATAQLRLGPHSGPSWARVWTPPLSPLVLRYQGQEWRMNTPLHLWRARGRFANHEWTFYCRDSALSVRGRFFADREAFTALDYRNPPTPNASKVCMNSKIASAEIEVKLANGTVFHLTTKHRAAFEMLGDASELARLGCT